MVMITTTPVVERIELFSLHVPFREAVQAAMARSTSGLATAIPAEEPWTGADFVIARAFSSSCPVLVLRYERG